MSTRTPSATDAVLARLVGVRPSGNGWTARCPSHEDERPSLGVTAGEDGRVLLYCHAGCTTEAVVAALGLTMNDLFARQEDGSRPELRRGSIVATYPYHDESGAVLFEVVRYFPKDFRVRHPNGRGGWVWSARGIRAVPYRLPEVIEAARAGRWIFVVEGEKDAERLAKLGFVATCNSGGANKWKPELSEHFRGGCVAILPDNDEVGQKHATDVASKLRLVAKEVRLIELPNLPPKGDVSDWLDADGTRAALQTMLSAEQPSGPAADSRSIGAADSSSLAICLADVEPEEVEFLWAPYLPRRKLTLLEGDPGEGKTFVALDLAARISRGDPLPGQTGQREPERVLYWSAEDGIADTLRPRLDAAGADVRNVFAVSAERSAGGVLTLDHVQQIASVLSDIRPALLVVDPIQAVIGPTVDMHRANEVRPRLSRLSAWAEEYNLAVLVIRHLSKAPSAKAVHRGLGSIDFAAAARSIVLVGRTADDPERRGLVQTKNSVAALGPSFEFRISDDRSLYWKQGPSTITAASLLGADRTDEDRSSFDDASEFLLQLLNGGPVGASEVLERARQAGISKRTVERAKASLGIVSKKDGPNWAWDLPRTPPPLRQSHAGGLGGVVQSEAVATFTEDRQGRHTQEDLNLCVTEPATPISSSG